MTHRYYIDHIILCTSSRMAAAQSLRSESTVVFIRLMGILRADRTVHLDKNITTYDKHYNINICMVVYIIY